MKKGQKIKLEIWERYLLDILHLLFSQSKSAYVGGLSFGQLIVISNHKINNQKWTLNDKPIDPFWDLTIEQQLEIYHKMEDVRLKNLIPYQQTETITQ